MNCFKHYQNIPNISICAECNRLGECQKRRQKRVDHITEKAAYRIKKKIENNYNGGVYEAGIRQ
jgi:hypothetical protein